MKLLLVEDDAVLRAQLRAGLGEAEEVEPVDHRRHGAVFRLCDGGDGFAHLAGSCDARGVLNCGRS